MNFTQQYPDHEHTKEWILWIDQGLTCNLTMMEIQAIMAVENTEQLYNIVSKSPAITRDFDIIWDQGIMYRRKNLEKMF